MDDDQQMVYGYASTPSLDSQGEIITLDAIKSALPDYMKFPTIREMHQSKAVGTTKHAELKGDGLFIGAKIVDKNAWQMVKEGVFRGFSIGGRIKQKVLNTITDMQLMEISLVDVPANSDAVITLFKNNDDQSSEDRHLSLLKNLVLTVSSSEQVEKMRLLARRVTIMAEAIEKAKKEVVKEEVKLEVIENKPEVEKETEKKVEEVKAEVAPEVVVVPEVVVDEAKQIADQPSDIMKRLDVVESSLDQQTEVKKEVEISKVDKIEMSIAKVASVLEKLAQRIQSLENQPAQPKTRASFLVDKGAELVSLDESSVQKAKLEKRLGELMRIRDTDLNKYQSNYQSEALDTLDQLAKLK